MSEEIPVTDISEGSDDDGQGALLNRVQYLYVNHAEVAVSPWDVRIALGEELPSGAVEARCGVTVSWECARLLLDSLTEVLSPTEEQSAEDQVGSEAEHSG
jgi:hypothetical protein